MNRNLLIMNALLIFGESGRYAVPIKELDKSDEGAGKLGDLDFTDPAALWKEGSVDDKVEWRERLHL